MRAKDATRLSVLRMLKSALKYGAIAKSGAEAELSDAEAAQVIRKQVKQRQDSIESFEKGGRTELGGEGGSRNDRRDRGHIESPDGRGDESVAGESRRSCRRQNAECGSAKATFVIR